MTRCNECAGPTANTFEFATPSDVALVDARQPGGDGRHNRSGPRHDKAWCQLKGALYYGRMPFTCEPAQHPLGLVQQALLHVLRHTVAPACFNPIAKAIRNVLLKLLGISYIYNLKQRGARARSEAGRVIVNEPTVGPRTAARAGGSRHRCATATAQRAGGASLATESCGLACKARAGCAFGTFSSGRT